MFPVNLLIIAKVDNEFAVTMLTFNVTKTFVTRQRNSDAIFSVRSCFINF